MAGKLQNEDFKTETELVNAGGSKSQLLNDTKVYVTANSINKTLDDAIIDGDIGGGGSGDGIVEAFTSVTVTGSWTTNTTYSAQRARVGDRYLYDILVTLSGAPNSATLTINLDAGVTIDTGKMVFPSSNGTLLGSTCDIVDNPTVSYMGMVTYNGTTSVRPKAALYSASFPNSMVQSSITETFPFTFGSGDTLHITFSVPVVGLAAS